ncbi:MAG: hypothetical protein K8L99_00545 [Anaerolineae bacterium]|nr:hypothetical protein [Anaerolineae bacterium]
MSLKTQFTQRLKARTTRALLLVLLLSGILVLPALGAVNTDFESIAANTYIDTINTNNLVPGVTFTSAPTANSFRVVNFGGLVGAPFAGNILGNSAGPGAPDPTNQTLTLTFSQPQDSFSLSFGTDGNTDFQVQGLLSSGVVFTLPFTGVDVPATGFPRGTATGSGTVFDQLILSSSATRFVMDNLVTTDAPVPGMTVTESGGTTDITEGGATDSYTIELDVAPSANVTIDITPDAQCTVLPTTLTFMPGNFDTPQAVTVTAVDDGVIEGAHSCVITNSIGAGSASEYLSVGNETVTANVTDNDVAGVTVNPTTISIAETAPGSNTYALVLDTVPSASVTITPASSDITQCTVSGAVTFTTGNWDTPQNVTVTAVDDALAEGAHFCTITNTVQAGSATEYLPVMVSSVTANITDNDVAGVTVNPTTISIAETAPGSNTYDLVLDTMPTASVTITPASSDITQCTVSGAVTFTTGNWDTPQNVTVTAVDDALVEGAHFCTITNTVQAGSAAEYLPVMVSSVTANITDNDVPGISPGMLPVNITEGGATDTYTLVLNTIPTNDVDITITPDAQCTVNPTTLTFMPGNYDTPQQVTVTAVDDTVVEGAHTCVISNDATSTDATYNGLNVNVTAQVTDNDSGPTRPPSGGGSSSSTSAALPPSVPLCADIGGSTNTIVRASVSPGTVPNGYVYCRVIAQNSSYIRSANEIGNQSVLDMGVIQAVDVFGLQSAGNSVANFTLPVNVCLLGSGGIVFLDATAAPRMPQPLPASSSGGYTCAAIPNAGTVVLTGVQLVAPAAPVQQTTTQTSAVQTLTNCRVTATVGNLRVRSEPVTGDTVTHIGYEQTFVASACQGNWFRIEAFGESGWVSGDYLNLSEGCGG